MNQINFRYDALESTQMTQSTQGHGSQQGIYDATNPVGIFHTVIVPVAFGLVMTVIGFVVSVLIITNTIIDMENDASRPTSAADLWLLAAAVVVSLTVGIGSFVMMRKVALKMKEKKEDNLARVRWFAANNNLTVSGDPLVDPDQQPGLLFRHGSFHNLSITLSSQSEPYFQLANGSCLIKPMGDKSFSYRYAFIRLKLPRQVPHMVLDSPKNNMLSAIGSVANGIGGASHQLRLEGDFNEHFRLFVPEGYERDALYIFTPDIMELMIETVNDYDIELVDDSLYIWRPGAFEFSDASELRRLEQIINRILPKITRRTDYYADDRTAQTQAGRIARDGQRIT